MIPFLKTDPNAAGETLHTKKMTVHEDFPALHTIFLLFILMVPNFRKIIHLKPSTMNGTNFIKQALPAFQIKVEEKICPKKGQAPKTQVIILKL